MRTRNSLDRLAAVTPAEPPLDALEEDRILGRIVATERRPARPDRRRLALALAAVAVLAVAAIAASLEIGHAGRVNTVKPNRGGHAVLTGAKIEAAGYHFRTPAGFTAAGASCTATSSDGKPVTVMNGFAAAASADGGCVEVLFLIAGSQSAPNPDPPPGQPVDVGSYHGYYDPQSDGGANLYVELPQGDARPVFLVLYAESLTEDQLIAVAVSGLPDGQPTTPASATG